MDELFSRAAARGLLVMPDMHRLSSHSFAPELWWDSKYSYQDFQRGWDNVVGG